MWMRSHIIYLILLSNKLPRLDYLPDFTGLLYKQKTKEMNRIY